MQLLGPKSIEHFPLEDIHNWESTGINNHGLIKPPVHEQKVRNAFLTAHVLELAAAKNRNGSLQDESFTADVNTARSFIQSELGYESTAPVSYRQRVDELNGAYDILEDSIVIHSREQDVNEYMKRVGRTSSLVHEMAHESSTQRKLSIIAVPTGDRIKLNFGCAIGLATLKSHEGVPITQNDFFEEAFAETVAVRWREQTIPDTTGRGEKMVYASHWNMLLPTKYFIPSHGFDTDGPASLAPVYPGIAAYGIDLLSKHIGVNLYDQMKKVRQTETAAEAKCKFIKTINSVHPDLYRTLRNLKYDQTTNELQKGLAAIQTAIYYHSQKTPVKATSDN